MALLLAALLNGAELERTARRQPLGWRRDALVDVATAVHTFSDRIGMTALRHGLETATGREPQPVGSKVSSTATGPPSASPPAGAPASRRTPTKATPLRLWIGGDSVIQVVGESLVTMTTATGVIAPELEFHISTGLARPDYFDWPARLEQVVAREQPDAVVVMFGAHDVQGMETSSGPAAFGTTAWLAEYKARVDRVMALLSDSGRLVYWVGQPVMRSATLNTRMASLNAIYRDEAQRHPGVRFIDTVPATSDAGGGYSSYLPGAGGEPVLARAPDGVHFERAGGDIVARLLLASIEGDWGLPAR